MDDPDVDIAPTVFFAYTDISAAASRALFSLEGDRTYQSLKLPLLNGYPPACVHSPQTKVTKQSPPMDTIQTISCRYAQKRKPQYTLLIINAHVPDRKSHYVAKAVLDLCSQRHVMKLVILNSQRLEIEQKNRLFENTFNGMLPVTQRTGLPTDTVITDAFLSNLIQMCTLDSRPFTLLTAPGHRIVTGQANSEDGTLQSVRIFQNTITDYCGVMFSEEVSNSLVFRDKTDGSLSAMMYA